jgi:cell fate regulator YaaT (PSP1 superfamily)
MIAGRLNKELHIEDVEFRGDGRNITIYYRGGGRIVFRTLIHAYATAFQVRIEMKQIGAKQRTAKIGHSQKSA